MMSRICVIAALLAVVSFAAADQGQIDYTSLPQNTADDIHLPVERAPTVPSSFCFPYSIPMLGRLDLNISFVNATKLRLVSKFLDRPSFCDNIEYRFDNSAKEVIIPKQNTDCVSLLVLSYVMPVSQKLGLDKQARDGLRAWMRTANQCAGTVSP